MPQPHFTIKPEVMFVGATVRAFNYTRDYGNQPALLWHWDWGDNTYDPEMDHSFSPTHVYLNSGTYTVKLTVTTDTDPACVAVVESYPPLEVEKVADIAVPNVFKPKLDGDPGDVIPERGLRNHLFFPPVLTPIDEYHMVIFNRLGILIYETRDQNRGWSGYYNGRLCEEDVYMYKIQGVFQNGQHFLKVGDILLLR